jgi:hypothetical protein
METAEKEVPDTSGRGFGGVPQSHKSPMIGGFRGLNETISVFSNETAVNGSVVLSLFPLYNY